MIAGWKKETTYGENAFDTPASDVATFFGEYLAQHEIPMPWHNIEMTPVYRLGNILPVNLVEGAKNVEFTMKFCPLSADEWKYALGGVSDDAGSPPVTSFIPSSTIGSRTIYIKADNGEWVYVLGCVVRSIDFFADKDIPTQVDIKFLGAEVVKGTDLTNQAPVISTGCAITTAWGWTTIAAATLDVSGTYMATPHNIDPTDTDANDLGQIIRVHVHVENVLRTRIRDKVVEIKKIAMVVMCTFDLAVKDVNNEIVKAVQAGEVNDVYFYWLTGIYYWKMYINNLKMRPMKCQMKVNDAEVPTYTIVGSACYDTTRTDTVPEVNEVKCGYKTAITVVVKDGADYTP